MRILRIIREIRNYFYQLRQIRKHRKTVEWNKHKLRTNWFGTIGTVINLPPDVFQGEEIYYQVYVIEQMKPINRYLESLNLQEIVYPRMTSLVNPDEGIYAYLVKYYPLMKDFTWSWLLSRSALFLGIWWLQAKFSVFTWIYDVVAELISKI